MLTAEQRQEIALYQEATYNLGRAFQEIQFNHLAADAYQECLNLADQYPFLCQGYNGRDSTDGQRGLHVTKESAHNLILIYRHSNAKDLAFSVMRKYLCFA